MDSDDDDVMPLGLEAASSDDDDGDLRSFGDLAQTTKRLSTRVQAVKVKQEIKQEFAVTKVRKSATDLLKERKKKVKRDSTENIEEITKTLDETLQRGGFAAQLEDVAKDLESDDESLKDEELDEDARGLLKAMEGNGGEIPSRHPHEAVFVHTDQLLMKHRLIIPNPSLFEDYLMEAANSVSNTTSVILSQQILRYYRNREKRTEICEWLFGEMVGAQTDPRVQRVALLTLTKLSQLQYKETKKHWIPSFATVIKVLLSCGATPETLSPAQPTSSFVLPDVPFSDAGVPSSFQMLPAVLFGRLQVTLQLLCSLFAMAPGWPLRELKSFVAVLLRASLDHSMSHVLHLDISNTIGAVLKVFPATRWEEEAVDLARMISGISKHHHSLTQLANVLPCSVRAKFLRHVTVLFMLKRSCHHLSDAEGEITLDLSAAELKRLKVNQHLPLYRNALELVDISNNSTPEDIYTLHSIIMLLDIGIDNEDTLSGGVAAALKKINSKYTDPTGQCLDRTQVKGFTVRILGKLDHIEKSAQSQRKLSDFFGTPEGASSITGGVILQRRQLHA